MGLPQGGMGGSSIQHDDKDRLRARAESDSRTGHPIMGRDVHLPRDQQTLALCPLISIAPSLGSPSS